MAKEKEVPPSVESFGLATRECIARVRPPAAPSIDEPHGIAREARYELLLVPHAEVFRRVKPPEVSAKQENGKALIVVRSRTADSDRCPQLWLGDRQQCPADRAGPGARSFFRKHWQVSAR